MRRLEVGMTAGGCADFECVSATSYSLSTEELARSYLTAKRSVVECGYTGEIAWQAKSTGPVTPQRLLREAAWVILCSGMKESVVSRLFPAMGDRLWDFDPELIASAGEDARSAALSIFRHEGKVDSILRIAERVRALDASELEARLRDPEAFLMDLPYIGPITWRHLAKNLGAPVAKADRHLSRLTDTVGRASVDDLCAEISSWLGDPVPVVDIVLWRWSVLHAVVCERTCRGIPPWDLKRYRWSGQAESREVLDDHSSAERLVSEDEARGNSRGSHEWTEVFGARLAQLVAKVLHCVFNRRG